MYFLLIVLYFPNEHVFINLSSYCSIVGFVIGYRSVRKSYQILFVYVCISNLRLQTCTNGITIDDMIFVSNFENTGASVTELIIVT